MPKQASRKPKRGKTSSTRRTGRSARGVAEKARSGNPASQRRGTAAKRTAPSAPLLRTSERTAFERCRWAWDRNYNDRLQPVHEAPALRFGSLIHKALELRYPPGIKRGPKPAVTFQKLYDEELKVAERDWGFRDGDGEWAEAGQLGVAMLENYVDTYGRDEEWKVIASEMTFKVPVHSPPHPEGGYMNLRGERIPKRVVLYYYVGTMDGVWQSRMNDSVLVNDYKTTSNDPTKEAQGKALLDEQGSAYWTWGVDYLIKKKVLKPRHQELLAGMLYTFLYKAAPDQRPVNSDGQALNKDGAVSQRQPVPRFHRELVYRDRDQCDRARVRATQQAMEMQAVRDGTLAARKSPGLTYPDQQCKACGYFDLCELDETGHDWSELRDASMKPWDPYDAHEIKEEGK